MSVNKTVTASAKKSADKAYFRLRIHDDMLERVRGEAEQNYRSMTAQITHIIAEHYSRKDARLKKRPA